MNVDDQPDRQPDADLTDAWVYAANCRLYENDPGPAELNIASRLEPMWVSRAEAFRDLYARLLLEELDADAARIAVLARQITAKTKQKPPTQKLPKSGILPASCVGGPPRSSTRRGQPPMPVRAADCLPRPHISHAQWYWVSGCLPTRRSSTTSYSKRSKTLNKARTDVETAATQSAFRKLLRVNPRPGPRG